ncbi:MAG: tetratricopeptide repeat protein [Niastella sp.]|jgi:tetratricopeptide (TPR) repeat protein|uniref:tetratricopeptide repeat protein n=1 Tax=Niastella sp. TaxID=1869183 RepID=UPI00389B1C60
MKFYSWLIRYRLYLGLALIALGVLANVYSGFWPAFPAYLIGLILIAGHFFIGPLRLIQEHMEAGDLDGAKRVLHSIKYPNLLYKPIRSAFFTFKGQLAMMEQDFDSAEKNMKKGLDLGTPMKEVKGASMLQMGMISLQKNDFKQAEKYIRQAIREGLPDKENEAAAYLQMCNIMMNKREFRAAKEFFRKAKALKPTTAEIVKQIKELEKHIPRLPG